MLKSLTNRLFFINLALIIVMTIIDEFCEIKFGDILYPIISIITIILGMLGLIMGIIEFRKKIRYSLVGLLGNLFLCLGFIYFTYEAIKLVKNDF
jgi:hypothetical protein